MHGEYPKMLNIPKCCIACLRAQITHYPRLPASCTTNLTSCLPPNDNTDNNPNPNNDYLGVFQFHDPDPNTSAMIS